MTAENHNVIGGLGDAVLGALSKLGLPVKTAKVGVEDAFGSVGPQDFLQEKYGLTAARIVQAVKGLQ